MKKILFVFMFAAFYAVSLFAWIPEERANYKFKAMLDTNYAKVLAVAKIDSLTREPVKDPQAFVKEIDHLNLTLKSSIFKNRHIKLNNYITGQPVIDVSVKKGNKILVWVEARGDTIDNAYVADYYRMPVIIFLIVIFFGLFFIVSKRHGIRSLAALTFNVILIFKFLFPLILNGGNILVLGIASVTIMSFVTFVFINGFKTKSLAALVGTIIGTTSAFLIAAWFRILLHLTGLSQSTSRMLQYLKGSLDFGQLLLLAVIIGALGAVMDIAMDLSSALYEIHGSKPDISRRELIKRGFNIGQDVLGTMINTLIFAYIGSSLTFILLYYASGMGTINIMNFQTIAQQYLQAIVGSIGLVITVPATIFSTVFFFRTK